MAQLMLTGLNSDRYSLHILKAMQLACIPFKTGCKCIEKLLILQGDPISIGHRYTRPSNAASCTTGQSMDQATGRSNAGPVRVSWTRQSGIQQALGK